jgi:hypothetical protein
MKALTVLNCAAVAVAMALTLAASPTRADDCDDIVNALKKHGDEVMKADPKTPPALCAGFGQMLALSQAIRIVADECYDEGDKKRTDTIKDMDETAKVFQAEIASTCK